MIILLVDDNDLFVELMSDIVTGLGSEFAAAGSGEAAIAFLQTAQRCDLIFMDYGLPGGMSGIVTAAEIRKLAAPMCDVPIIGLTGGMVYDDLEMRGAARFAIEVKKPILPADIELLISRYARPIVRC